MNPLVLIPIAIVLFAIGTLSTSGQKPKAPAKTKRGKTIMSGETYRPEFQIEDDITALDVLAECVRSGEMPDDFLVSEAIEAAYMKGDIALADAIATAFEKQEGEETSPEASSAECPFSTRKWPSPIEGVSDDDWSDFVVAMKVDDSSSDSPSHVGAFRHKKSRLSQLGIGIPKTPEEQVGALARDVTDCISRGKALIGEFTASPVSINGESEVMTASGIAAVMKAAGVANARKWITSEKDKSAFPETTKIFLKANGCF